LSALLAAAVLAIAASAASAGTVNVLWYTGGTENGAANSYETAINALPSQAFTASGNTWGITYWTGGALPVGSFNVLVVASKEGGWSTNPDYAALTSAAGSITLGDRVMVTGQDADFHYMNFPGGGTFNGPQGFLVDSINWAGSGTGMGAVFLSPGGSPDVLTTFLTGLGTRTTSLTNDTVNIPAAFASFPINTGLTSAGLSNWGQSDHDNWTGFSSAWTAINTDGSGKAITLVSAATASGSTSVPVPNAASLSLLGLGLVGMYSRLRKNRAKA
jgi:hypothetical protein